MPLGKVISNPAGRRFVIADVHGCINTLTNLVDKLNINIAEDQVFLLGDYVNKGPDSTGVLDYMIEWTKNAEVYPLLGNHDAILMEALQTGEYPEGFEQFGEIAPAKRTAYINFLEALPYYYILDDFILVHAGMNFTLANPFLGKEEMLNIRDFYYDSSKAQSKSVVHGHNPFSWDEIVENINNRNKILPLDNGCVYAGKREGMGKLVCLELNNLELHWLENCD